MEATETRYNILIFSLVHIQFQLGYSFIIFLQKGKAASAATVNSGGKSGTRVRVWKVIVPTSKD